ncbi:hypothetical protein [Homoserinimonas sp. A520]
MTPTPTSPPPESATGAPAWPADWSQFIPDLDLNRPTTGTRRGTPSSPSMSARSEKMARWTILA